MDHGGSRTPFQPKYTKHHRRERRDDQRLKYGLSAHHTLINERQILPLICKLDFGRVSSGFASESLSAECLVSLMCESRTPNHAMRNHCQRLMWKVNNDKVPGETPSLHLSSRLDDRQFS